MKVAYVVMQYPTQSETFLFSDIRALSRKKVVVDIFSLMPEKKDSLNLIASNGLGSHYSFAINFYNYFWGLFLCFLNIKQFLNCVLWFFKREGLKVGVLLKLLILMPSAMLLFKKIQRRNYDVVHLFWGHYPALVGYLIKKNDVKSKLSIFLGAYDLSMNLGISKAISFEADSLFTHSFSNIEILKKNGFDYNRFEVVHRGVDLFRIQTSLPSISDLSFESRKMSYLSAGRLICAKRYDRCVEYIANSIDADLTFVGSGPDASRLKDKVVEYHMENRVSFFEFSEQLSLFRKMRVSKFFLFFSEKPGERLPNVLKEAMYFGCVCIVSQTPGIHELIKNGSNGFVLRHGESIKELYGRVNDLSPAEYNNISRKAKDTIVEYFDVDVQMSKYISVWRK